jgi:NAD(P)-dependent dehydrogenase (short-subunit alcohol dehydrogenase family)
MNSKKCFVITGASSGLGKAMKDFLISETHHFVVSLSRKVDPEDISTERIWYSYCDLASLDNTDFIKDICNTYRDEDIIYINNAATILPLCEVGCFKDEELTAYFKINVEAPIRLINELVALKKKGLTVLNISSGAAKRAISHWSLYCSAKAAVNMFCDVLTIDHPEVIVRNIDPGVINTQMQSQIRESNIPDRHIFTDLSGNEQLKEPTNAAREILIDLV